MSQYKELAWALDTYDEDDKQRDQIAAILRGLDAQRPTVDEVMKLAKDACDLVSRHVTAIRERGDIELASMESFSAMENLRTAIEALAAPVAAQPQQAKPAPLSDADYYEIGQRYSMPTVKIQAIHRELEAKRGIKETV